MVHIRPATPEDLPQVNAILTHYILNTVITFDEVPHQDVDMLYRYEKYSDLGLPYLVAVEEADLTKVLGYAYAWPYFTFPAGLKLSYRPKPSEAVAIYFSLYVHHQAQARGIGTGLLDALIKAQKDSTPQRPSGKRPVKLSEVVSLMTVDEEVGCGGTRLQQFYTQRGFQIVGRMNDVGFEFGRKLDTLILQLSLE